MSLLLLFRPMSGVGGQPEPEPEPRIPDVFTPGPGGSRKRLYRVPIYEEIEDEIRVEEKKVEKDKKKLKILIKQSTAPNVEGVLYQQFQHKIEKLEAKIDRRLEKVADLIRRIEVGVDEINEDDEEVLLLS